MTESDSNSDVDSTEKVINTTEKVQFGVDVTRGTGTRDQEKWKLRATGETAEEALAEFEQLVAALHGGYGDQLRSFDPDKEPSDVGEVGDFDEFDG